MECQLVLTNLDKFLDVDAKIVFLGDWCRKYKDRHFWETKDYEIASDAWGENFNTEKEDAYCLDLVERLLESIAEMLNILHEEKHTIEYWKFILLQWVYSYIYEWRRYYMEVKSAFISYKKIKVNILKVDEKEYPFSEYKMWLKEGDQGDALDLYMWLSYSRIIKFFSKKWDCNYNEIDLGDRILKRDASPISIDSLISPNRIKKKLKEIYLHAFKTAPIVCWGFMIGGKQFKKIVAENIGRVLFASLSGPMLKEKYELDVRKKMTLNFYPENEFEEFLKKNILLDFPQYALENYKDLVAYRNRQLWKHPKVVIMQVSTIPSIEGVLLAEWYEQGTEFFFRAHSTMEAMYNIVGSETSLLLGGKMYSWGYSGDIRKPVCPSFKAYEGKDIKKGDVADKSQILWCGSGLGVQNIITNHPLVAYTSNREREEALENYSSCLDTLNPSIQACLLYRPRDIGNWGMVEFFREHVPNLKVDKTLENKPLGVSKKDRESLLSRFEESRIIICESLMTTVFYQALYANIPVIVIEKDIYSNMRDDFLYPDVLSYFRELREAGIWYENGREAAEVINKNYNTIDEWWLMPERQSIRQKVVDRFFMYTNDLASWWKKEFRRLLLEV